MEDKDITEGSKIIAGYLGWVYIPFNDLQGLSKPGWYKRVSADPKIENVSIKTWSTANPEVREVFKDVNMTPLRYNFKNGWIKNGNFFYSHVCRSHAGLKFFNSMDELIIVIEKIQNDWSIEKLGYSWEMEGETRYNFEGFEFNLYKNGAYSEINLSLDPPLEIAKSFDDNLTWVQNTFKVVVETIKYINGKF